MEKGRLLNKNVLIFGGLGFIGSNLARALVQQGARVTVYDSLLPGYGGNRFNLNGIEKEVETIEKDIRDQNAVEQAVQKKDLVFNFAAQVSYIDSLKDPFFDLDVNVKGHLGLLEACRKLNREAKIFFSSSRFIYGKHKKEIVSEMEAPKPLNLYGIHKLVCEHYQELYSREFEISSVVFRIMNPYGPRQQMLHSKYSLVGWFIRQAMEGKTLTIFGDGKQKRDYIFVDDLVSAMISVGEKEFKGFHCFNLGTGVGVPFGKMVSSVVETVGRGRVEYVQWPKNYETIETGSFIADVSKLEKFYGWKAKIQIEEGVEKTFDYYKKCQKHYWE